MDYKLTGLMAAVLVLGIAAGLGLSGLSGFTIAQSPEGEWVCASYGNCTQWIEGQEWISQNCVLNETADLNCDFALNGQLYQNVPLTQLKRQFGVENLKGCVQQECLLEVLARKPGQ